MPRRRRSWGEMIAGALVAVAALAGAADAVKRQFSPVQDDGARYWLKMVIEDHGARLRTLEGR